MSESLPIPWEQGTSPDLEKYAQMYLELPETRGILGHAAKRDHLVRKLADAMRQVKASRTKTPPFPK